MKPLFTAPHQLVRDVTVSQDKAAYLNLLCDKLIIISVPLQVIAWKD